jgi:hypothetical protein
VEFLRTRNRKPPLSERQLRGEDTERRGGERGRREMSGEEKMEDQASVERFVRTLYDAREHVSRKHSWDRRDAIYNREKRENRGNNASVLPLLPAAQRRH